MKNKHVFKGYKKIEKIFQQKIFNDFVINKQKQMNQLQNNIQLNNLEYPKNEEKFMVSVNTH